MSKSLTLMARQVLIVACMSIGLASTTPAPAHARNPGGNVDRGRALARAWCAECHRVEPGGFGIFAANFAEVANLPSTTALSLRVFLHSSHKEMPNFSLEPSETDDVIAYLLSLKRK